MKRRNFLLRLGSGFLAFYSWGSLAKAAEKVAGPVGAPDAWGEGISPAELKTSLPGEISGINSFRLFYCARSTNRNEFHLVSYHSRRGFERSLPLPMASIHGLVISPDKKHLVILPSGSPLIRSVACVVDLERFSLAAELTCAGEGNFFPGHAAFSPDGKSIFLPENGAKNFSPGYVAERSFPELKLLRTLATGNFKPHSVLFSRDGKKMVVGHYGNLKGATGTEHGGVSILDSATGRILSKPEWGANNLAGCHLARDEDDNIFVSSRWITSFFPAKQPERVSPFVVGKLGAEKWEPKNPADLADRFRFNFSVCYSPKHKVVALNHLDGHMLSLWGAPNGGLRTTVDFTKERPLSLELTPDEEYFAINTMEGSLFLVKAKDGKLAERLTFPRIGDTPHFAIMAAT